MSNRYPFIPLGILVVAACSLGNVHRDDCTSDAECAAAFGVGSTCSIGFCTAPKVAGCNGKRADGLACGSCPPQTTNDFENACGAAACAPFDNATRLTKLAPDGSLPPLP
jgi:hypothetical protein